MNNTIINKTNNTIIVMLRITSMRCIGKQKIIKSNESIEFSENVDQIIIEDIK